MPSSVYPQSLTLQRGPEGPFQFYICLILTISLFKSVLEVIDDIVYILDAD